MITADGITMGFIGCAGPTTASTSKEVARVMEYSQAYQLYRDDVEVAEPAVTG
ncbi:MAG: hypothetical protein M3325_05760 [Actinomycetota bacterium]|nr:hypothetical protein [Actinomycetota bacterium]